MGTGENKDLLTKLKARIQVLMVKEAQLLHNLGLKPNHLTIIGILFAYLSALMYGISGVNQSALILAAGALLISGFFDALDGILARQFGEVTGFGGFLDSLLDRYADAFVFLGVLFGWLLISPFWVFCGFAAMIGSLLVSYSRARAEAAGIKMESVGVAERAERLIILIAATLLNLVWTDALRWSMLLLAVLTNITVLQRGIYFRNASRKKEAITQIA